MKSKPVYGLVCTGGGARGAYQVGVLKYIHEKFTDGRHSPFKIFAGSSCGSLNSSFYAAQSFDAHASRLWLEDLWLSFHVPAYHGNMLKNAIRSIYKEWRRSPYERQTAWALLDPSPMLEIIKKGFFRKNLERSIAEGSTRGIAVAATELLTGRTCWFQEGIAATPWNLFHSIGIIDCIEGAHMAASSSVPIFLPPVKIGQRYFLDGSISLDRPFSAAISMGASKILSIATDQPIPQHLPSYAEHFRPRLSNVVRLLLNELSHDRISDEADQIEMFNRFYEALSRKNRRAGKNLPRLPLFDKEALPAHYRPTEIFLVFPSKQIRETAGISPNDEGKSPRRRRTRFMFHRKFIQELIGLGYDDAKSKHEALRNFFLPEAATRRWFLFKRGRS